MKRAIAVLLILVGCVAASGAQAGIPGKSFVRCNITWKGPYFKGGMLLVDGTIRCTRPMLHVNGYAALVRMRMDAGEQLGSPSSQASGTDAFFRVKVSYIKFTLSHVCKPTDVSYKWWATVHTTARYKSWSRAETRQNFSHTVITDCG